MTTQVTSPLDRSILEALSAADSGMFPPSARQPPDTRAQPRRRKGWPVLVGYRTPDAAGVYGGLAGGVGRCREPSPGRDRAGEATGPPHAGAEGVTVEG